MKNGLSGIGVFLLAVILNMSASVYGDMEWVRLKGVVKNLNPKAKTVTLMNREGDVFTVPITEDVKILDSKDVNTSLSGLVLNQKVTLLCIHKEKEIEDTGGLVPPRFPSEQSQRGL